MPLPIQDENHLAEGLALRLGQYLDKQNIEALISVALEEIQEIEDMLWDVIASQLLSRTFPAGTAQGELDGPPDQALLQMGDLVGAPFGQFTTRQLAFLVLVWIAARKSNGRAEDLIGIMSSSFPSSDDLNYEEFYPASFEVWIVDMPPDANNALVAPFALALQIAGPAGVSGTFAWGSWPTQTFFFGDGVSLQGSGLASPYGATSYAAGLLMGQEI